MEMEKLAKQALAEQHERIEVLERLVARHDLESRPIPVSERLPEDGACVLAFGLKYRGKSWFESHYKNGQFLTEYDNAFCCADCHSSVTHWLPMPPKPE
jgi:hypothetical protein